EKINWAARNPPLIFGGRTEGSSRCSHRLTHTSDIHRPVRRSWLPQERSANLEYPYANSTPVQVVAHIRDQPPDQTAAHDRELAGNWVEQPYRLGIAGKIGFPGWLDKAEIYDFLIVSGGQRCTQGMQGAACL